MTGLRGCFAYVHIADPENGIFESNEDNNEAQAIIRLPYRPITRGGAAAAVTADGPLSKPLVRLRGQSRVVVGSVMAKTLVIAEKPSVARDLASTLPGLLQAVQGQDLPRDPGRILNGDGYIVTWAVGHLVGLAPPDEYDPKLKKWRFADLPILPEKFKLIPNDERSAKQLRAIHRLMADDDVDLDRERLRRRSRGRADLRLPLRPRAGPQARPAPLALLDDEERDLARPSGTCARARR